MDLRAHLTRPARDPRRLALPHLACAAAMAVPAVWLARQQPAGWAPLLVGVGLLLVAFLVFAHASWRGEPVRWHGRARWGIVAALLAAAALALPL